MFTYYLMALEHEMDISGLNSQELSDVLQRAQQLEARQVAQAEAGHDLQSFIRAAEEVGIGREAIMQALREKVGHSIENLEVGERVFAKSADGAFYVAVVKEIRGTKVKVNFLHGSDHELPLADLRPFSLLPGQRLEVNWPTWGWWNVELTRYDDTSGKLTASDGLSAKEFSLTEARLPAQRTEQQQRVSALLFRVGIAAASAGAVIGALVARLLL